MTQAYWLPTLVLNPLWNISQRTFIPKITTVLGDNYSQTQNKGLEPVIEWDVKSPVMPESKLNILLGSLREYATTNFLWSPTGENLKQCALVNDWIITPSGVFNGQVYSSISNKIITSKIRNNLSVPRTDTYSNTSITLAFTFAFYSASTNTTTCNFNVSRSGSTSQVLIPWSAYGSQLNNATKATGADFVGNALPSGFVNFSQGQNIAFDAIKVSLLGDKTVFTDHTAALSKKAFAITLNPSLVLYFI